MQPADISGPKSNAGIGDNKIKRAMHIAGDNPFTNALAVGDLAYPGQNLGAIATARVGDGVQAFPVAPAEKQGNPRRSIMFGQRCADAAGRTGN